VSLTASLSPRGVRLAGWRSTFFEIVELPHLGPEDVDDNIAASTKNPIAVLQSFDARARRPP